MYTLEKSFKFEASHILENHDGKCSNLHGHSWILIVELKGNDLHADGPKMNMLVDYSTISDGVKLLLKSYLDHRHLNTTLKTVSPTSEFIAKWAYDKLFKIFGDFLVSITIEETRTSRCRYEG